MGEIPYKVTDEDIEAAYETLQLNRNRMLPPDEECVAETLQEFADRRFPASVWRPASKPPVVPEGKEAVLVFALHEAGAGPVPVVVAWHRVHGWRWKEILFPSGIIAWMPIPPHGKPEKEADV